MQLFIYCTRMPRGYQGTLSCALGGKAQVSAGRDENADIKIPVTGVATLQFEVTHRQGCWFLTNCGVGGSMRFKGQPLEQGQEVELRDGSRWTLAAGHLRFDLTSHCEQGVEVEG